jgi:hypothetical protein
VYRNIRYTLDLFRTQFSQQSKMTFSHLPDEVTVPEFLEDMIDDSSNIQDHIKSTNGQF